MQQLNRRDLGLMLSAFATLGGATSAAQSRTGEGARLAHSEIFAFDKLPVSTGTNGMATRAVIRGTLATGEYIEVHETTLPAGEMPHPPHRPAPQRIPRASRRVIEWWPPAPIGR